MANIQQKEKNLVLAAFWLIFIHLIVSNIFVAQNFIAAKKESQSLSKPLQLSAFGWMLSILVCLIVLIVLLSFFNYSMQYETTPCPIQLSYPSNSKDRTDIENFINDLAKMAANRLRSRAFPTTPPPEILAYDKNRTYIVITKYYLKKFNKGMTKPIPPIFTKYDTIPIGYLEDNKIYMLWGNEIWPDYSPPAM